VFITPNEKKPATELQNISSTKRQAIELQEKEKEKENNNSFKATTLKPSPKTASKLNKKDKNLNTTNNSNQLSQESTDTNSNLNNLTRQELAALEPFVREQETSYLKNGKYIHVSINTIHNKKKSSLNFCKMTRSTSKKDKNVRSPNLLEDEEDTNAESPTLQSKTRSKSPASAKARKNKAKTKKDANNNEPKDNTEPNKNEEENKNKNKSFTMDVETPDDKDAKPSTLFQETSTQSSPYMEVIKLPH
jgi:hypothetical protein